METDVEHRAQVIHRLAKAGCVAANEEADLLIGSAIDATALDAALARREAGEPLAWIIGTIDFCGRPIRVDPGVYVPRAQSDELARRAGRRLAEAAATGGRPARAVDLCTGSGAVACHLSAMVPAATVIGVDVDARAVTCARRNGVPAICADLAAPLRGGAFDVVTAVAPYVPTDEISLLPADVRRHEPLRALDGGTDGLALVRRVVTAAGRVLRTGGWLLLEVGGEQDVLLASDLTAAGFDSPTTWRDDNDDLRGLAARLARQVN
jgi:release factor glutamine methyltransferase